MPKRRPRVAGAKRSASHPAQETGPAAGPGKAQEEAVVQERTAARQAASAEAERRAREAKERHTLLQMILDHAPAGITVVGGPPDYPIVVNNRYALERLGRAPESLVGLSAGHHAPAFGLVRPDGRVPAPEELPLYRATRASEVVANEEWAIQRPDGTKITALCNVAPLKDAEGRIVGAVNCWRDITEQKRAEDARRLSDEKFRTAFRANPAGIVLSRLADGRILDANETFLRLFGYAREEVLGHTSEDLGMWGSPEERSLAVAALLRAGQLRDRELAVVTRSGDQRTVLLSAEVIRVVDEPLILAVLLDITERKHAEVERRELALFPAQNPDPVLRIAADGTILYGNPASAPLLEQWGTGIGRPCPPSLCAQLTACLQTGCREAVELVWADRTYAFSCAPFPEHGYANVYGHDVTARRRAEDALRAALREKEAALADKDTLLREVHHRTKNNLQMLGDVLYLQTETVQSPEGRRALQDSSSRLFAIARLHEQLYQTMESGRIRLGGYLGKLVAGVESVHPGVQVRLTVPAEPLYLDVDRAIHVGLIVNELVTNALKHAFPAGSPGEMGVDLRLAEQRVEVRVWDRGTGLPATFDLQSVSTLGLKIVRILSERLGAGLTVESAPGAVFTLTVPLASPDTA